MPKKTGRPTDYNEEVLKKSKAYIKSCVDKYIKNKLKVKLPTVEGLAIYLDVSRKTLYNWAEKHEAFLHTLEEIERQQKQRLIEMGLSGDYNPTIAKLILSANHGMKEKSDITTDNKPLPNPIYGGQSVQVSGHDSNEEDISTKEEN